MNNTWIEFLQTMGAQLDGDTLNFGNLIEEKRGVVQEKNTIASLSHFGLIQVSGSDTATFLQGQFTNDVFKVNANHSQHSAWCNHKGRIIVNFRLFKRGQSYYLLLPESSIATVMKRLKMYVLRADVQLENVSEKFVALGIAGTDCAEKLSQCLNFQMPTDRDSCMTDNEITLINIFEQKQGFIIISDTESAKNLWHCATETLQAIGTAAWELLNILKGVPQITPATSEEFVPQMINWDSLNGVSFQKGCYVGQEVVARVKYRGQIKRRLYFAQLDSSQTAQAGDALYASTTQESIGKIVNIQTHPDGGCVALISVQTNYVDTAEIRLNNGVPLQLTSLND